MGVRDKRGLLRALQALVQKLGTIYEEFFARRPTGADKAGEQGSLAEQDAVARDWVAAWAQGYEESLGNEHDEELVKYGLMSSDRMQRHRKMARQLQDAKQVRNKNLKTRLHHAVFAEGSVVGDRPGCKVGDIDFARFLSGLLTTALHNIEKEGEAHEMKYAEKDRRERVVNDHNREVKPEAVGGLTQTIIHWLFPERTNDVIRKVKALWYKPSPDGKCSGEGDSGLLKCTPLKNFMAETNVASIAQYTDHEPEDGGAVREKMVAKYTPGVDIISNLTAGNAKDTWKWTKMDKQCVKDTRD